MKNDCLPAIMLAMSLALCPPASAEPDDATGEVRLWISATFHGYYDYDWKDRGAGETAPAGVGSYRDRLTVVFSGTTIWRVQDFMIDPESMTQNCRISCDGGGSYSYLEKGVHWCGFPGADLPWTETSKASWRYSNPKQPEVLGGLLSPAGVVNVAPMFGVWTFQPVAFPNWQDLTQKGQWSRQRRYGCGKCRTPGETQVIDKENAVPGGTHAGTMAEEAYNSVFQGDGELAALLEGTFKSSAKGFFVSGNVLKNGGEPVHAVGSPPSGKPGDSYYTGAQGMWWTADVQWTLSYNQKPPPVELIIEPVPGYKKWKPEGGDSQAAPGNEMTVSTHLQVKGKPGKAPLQTGQFRFQLTGVSNERGIAMNKPLQSGATERDLKLEAGTAAEVTEKGATATTTSKALKAAYVKVRSYDFGSYGSLKVTATLDDGSVVYGHLEGQPTKEELFIPLDENKNHIADSWEDEEGVLGKNLPAKWDGQTEPELGGPAGDGLSLYDEYRGLVHGKNILRLSATLKNLVVENRMGSVAQPGLKRFEEASRIKVAELDAGELPEDRVVSLNRGTSSADGVQHGLRLVAEALPNGIIGMAYPDKIKTCPGECDRVAINTDLTFLPAANLLEFTRLGVAHELGHAVGAQHHGDTAPALENLTLTAAATKITGVGGGLITGRPYVLTNAIETVSQGGESSGQEDCLMRTANFYQWVQHLTRLGALHYYAVPVTAPGTIFCSSGNGTGINAPNNTPTSYFGNAAAGRGACLKHMRVRDY